ncbi:hypothetical protein GALMADRAFT_156022 [Galerina marginata CBS 339.88]|uniref:F-box domain-containing protein n=1 Tax=Galerina marginata (strain CBS 339.88) TaxID=685588 RepID=A0A067T056_GALM3|nr:hypothetical protein GALMADRAFT_156022 [Galerina marginata CBS 339.88]
MQDALQLTPSTKVVSNGQTSDSDSSGSETSSNGILPLELYEIILDYLPDDELSLRSCALVCHFFRLRSQKHLFRKIHIVRGWFLRPNKISLDQRFLDVIKHSPQLRNHVQILEISDHQRPKYFTDAGSWNRADHTMSEVLHLLQGLKEFKVTGHPRLNFSAWTRETRSAILYKSQFLASLSLSCIQNVPFAILRNAPALKSLALSQVMFVPEGHDRTADIDITGPTEISRLKCLQITTHGANEWRPLYLWLQDETQSIDLTSITELSLHIKFTTGMPLLEDMRAISWLLSSCSRSLKSLGLFYSKYATFYQDEIFDIGNMHSLQTLSLQGTIWNGWTLSTPHAFLQWLKANLDKVVQSRQLTLVNVIGTVDDFAAVPEADLRNPGWQGLQATILKFAQTTTVNVFIPISAACGEHTRTLLEDVLSPLRQSGFVNVDVKLDV